MANVSIRKMASGTLKPGDVHRWIWNNASSDRVWSFTVQPYPVTTSSGAWAAAEVGRVSQLVRMHPKPERELHVEVKNIGGATMNYDLLMSSVSE